eukprot:TRINITY_DN34076_c0_g1_i1.p1 TRINITY_DN34076_c0_g1~~TRINITY_DN34076_c0_g1_i1.p1  ORF type:complete len:394 (+),score=44.44 TRINITY_DN34076_c0_g1_i1:47-1228(+)
MPSRLALEDIVGVWDGTMAGAYFGEITITCNKRNAVVIKHPLISAGRPKVYANFFLPDGTVHLAIGGGYSGTISGNRITWSHGSVNDIVWTKRCALRPAQVASQGMLQSRVASSSQLSVLNSFSADLQSIFLSFSDELSLLRMTVVCTRLNEVARMPQLWKPFLLHYFGGDLPQELTLEPNPLLTLRLQVEAARRKVSSERSKKRFQLPKVESKGVKAWQDAIDDKVASAAGTEFAYYGAIGGAYSTKRRVHGTYTTFIMSGPLNKTFQIPWILPRKQVNECLNLNMVQEEYDLVTKWMNAKLASLAREAGFRGFANRISKSVLRRDIVKPDDYVEVKPADYKTSAKVSLPQLLSGLYGGIFEFKITPSSICDFCEIVCILDGSSISWGWYNF